MDWYCSSKTVQLILLKATYKKRMTSVYSLTPLQWWHLLRCGLAEGVNKRPNQWSWLILSHQLTTLWAQWTPFFPWTPPAKVFYSTRKKHKKPTTRLIETAFLPGGWCRLRLSAYRVASSPGKVLLFPIFLEKKGFFLGGGSGSWVWIKPRLERTLFSSAGEMKYSINLLGFLLSFTCWWL